MIIVGSGISGNRCKFSTLKAAALTNSGVLNSSSFVPNNYNTIIWQRKHNFSSALSKEEEEQEKSRVSTLSPEQKKKELRELDQKIKYLNTLRGINTGELYTWRGQMKALARDYGIGMSQRSFKHFVKESMPHFVFLACRHTNFLSLSAVSHLAKNRISCMVLHSLGWYVLCCICWH